MQGPRVSVTLVTHNARRDVRACLESVLAQRYEPFTVRVFDNASADGTAGVIAAGFPGVELHCNARNEGYAAPHNRGISLAREQDGAKYVFLLTPDVVLAPDHLAHLVRALEADAGVASAGGKLLRVDGRTLDGAGILATPGRHFRDRWQGEPGDDHRGVGIDEPFAACGAAVLHRLDALVDVAVAGEFLDESFFAYKEDIDLAWRLRLKGWRVLYVGSARAYHRRAAPYSARAAPGAGRSLAEVRRDRKALVPGVRRLSARNQLLLLVKNEHPRVLLSPDMVRIVGRQLALLAYAVFLEPSTLPAYLGFLARLPGALRRRWRFRRAVGYRECRSWFR